MLTVISSLGVLSVLRSPFPLNIVRSGRIEGQVLPVVRTWGPTHILNGVKKYHSGLLQARYNWLLAGARVSEAFVNVNHGGGEV